MCWIKSFLYTKIGQNPRQGNTVLYNENEFNKYNNIIITDINEIIKDNKFKNILNINNKMNNYKENNNNYNNNEKNNNINYKMIKIIMNIIRIKNI